MNKTVLYDQHERLGARIVDFGGFLLPVQYSSVLEEHRHCRTAASVFDCSHMGQYLIRGESAASALSAVCTQNAVKLGVGRCKYGFLLGDDGGVLDDTILMRLGADEFLLVVNAGGRDSDFEWIDSRLPSREPVELTHLSHAGYAKIDLQGPKSLEVLAPLCDRDPADMKYFGVRREKIIGHECILSRTGYTGELGYEIMAEGDAVCAVFEAVLENSIVKPAGLGARDSLRLEMCYPLYGHELSLEIGPIHAGLGMFLNTSRDYIGVEALRRLEQSPPDRSIVFFKAATRRRAMEGNKVLCGGASVGHVTSGAFSPSLETSIGAALIDTRHAEPGTKLQIDTGRATFEVQVAQRPLYEKGTARVKTQ